MGIITGFLHRRPRTEARAAVPGHAPSEASAGLPRPGWWEAVSLVVLTIGATGVPILGWLVGMSMVGLSDAWTDRDKTVAAVAPAGVVAVLVVVTAVLRRNDALDLLGLGPLALLVLFGGAVAGVLGAAYLAVRSIYVVATASRSGTAG